MDIIFQISLYIIFMIIGIILVTWYLKKKGWDGSLKLSLTFNFIWKTIIFFIFIGIDLLIEENWLTNSYSIYVEIIFLPIMILRFFINILLGKTLFEIIYRQKKQESIIIILIIVILELILESIILLLYPLLYLLTPL